MTDLIERLRDRDAVVTRGLFHAFPAMREAADELERLSSAVRGMREALTPSGDTKAAYSGEFKFKSPGGRMQYTIPWETIKEIMAAISALAALSVEEGKEQATRGDDAATAPTDRLQSKE